MAKGITRSDLLRSLADDLLRLADACEQPSRSVHRAGILIADGERIARGVWAVFRGRAPLRAIE